MIDFNHVSNSLTVRSGAGEGMVLARAHEAHPSGSSFGGYYSAFPRPRFEPKLGFKSRRIVTSTTSTRWKWSGRRDSNH